MKASWRSNPSEEPSASIPRAVETLLEPYKTLLGLYECCRDAP